MKLLWLTPEVPEPGGTGGAIRAYHQLRVLARRGVDVTVVAPTYPDQEERAEPLREQGVHMRLQRRPPSRRREVLAAVATRPALLPRLGTDPWLGWQAGVFWTEIGAAVLRAEQDLHPDAAIVEHDFAAQWGARLQASLPKGLALQNAKWSSEGTGRADVKAARFRRYVNRHLQPFSAAWTVSKADRAAVRSLRPDLPVDLIPNGTDLARLKGIEPGGTTPGRLLFTGTLSYPPNAEAVRWFVKEVLPRVRSQRTDISFEVVGRGAPADLQALDERDGLSIAGFVPAVEDRMQAAEVVVAPLRSGGGTKLKVLEALGAARAVVTTSVGGEGIAVRDGEHLLVRDDPGAFAAAVLELLDDRARALDLGIAGRRLVARCYDWETLGVAFHHSIIDWLSRPDPRPDRYGPERVRRGGRRVRRW